MNIILIGLTIFFLIGLVISIASIVNKTPIVDKPTTPNISQDIIIFYPNSFIDYSTVDNNPKTFIFGTFTDTVFLINMTFSIDINNSTIYNGYVNLVLSDNNNEVFNQQINNFTKPSTEINLYNLKVSKGTQVLLTINGSNIKLIKSTVTFKISRIIVITTIRHTTLQPAETT